MDAIIELKKFFAENPSLIELGKQLRNAQPHEKNDIFIVTSQPTDNGYELSRTPLLQLTPPPMQVAVSRFVERNSRNDPQNRPLRRPPSGGGDRLAVPLLYRSFTADFVGRH
ncbi:hypothetical protein TNCV_12631 [Trichonephila clavipes]|nr:hypothetical protein TNCV_12631 [Trichonephila clavipes]